MTKFLLTLFLLLAAPAFAQESGAGAAPSADAAVLQVQAYLNGIQTMQAQFVQTGADGREASGTLLLKRPGRMRIDYDPPVTDFIVADGLMVYYYDGKMKQQSSTPISRSLADFFLRGDLALSGDISVSDIKRDGKTIELTLTQVKNPLAGSLTLMLAQSPMQLLGWRIVDVDGQVTQVRLSGTLTGIALSNAPFHYYDPAHSAPRYNKN